MTTYRRAMYNKIRNLIRIPYYSTVTSVLLHQEVGDTDENEQKNTTKEPKMS